MVEKLITNFDRQMKSMKAWQKLSNAFTLNFQHGPAVISGYVDTARSSTFPVTEVHSKENGVLSAALYSPGYRARYTREEYKRARRLQSTLGKPFSLKINFSPTLTPCHPSLKSLSNHPINPRTPLTAAIAQPFELPNPRLKEKKKVTDPRAPVKLAVIKLSRAKRSHPRCPIAEALTPTHTIERATRAQQKESSAGRVHPRESALAARRT